MFGIQIQARVNDENRHEFLQACKVLAQLCGKNSCCVAQALYQDTFNPNVFLWSEQWNDHDSLKTHMQTAGYRSLLGAIEILGELDFIRMVEFRQPTEKGTGHPIA